MALARWQSTITDDLGNVQNAASVQVRHETGGAPLALIYSDRDGTTPLDNPFTTGSDGFAAFHVPGGAYKITATKGAFSREWRYVPIGTLAEQDFDNAVLASPAVTGGTFTDPTFDDYADFEGVAEPLAPSAGIIRMFARVVAGFTRPAFKDEDDNVFGVLSVGDITNYGGKGDGSADNTTALGLVFSTLVALGLAGASILFPQGQYNFASSPTLTMPSGAFSVTIAGEGQDSTTLHWPSGAGLVVDCSDDQHSVHVRHLTFTTGATNPGAALRLTNSVLLGVIQQSDITRCTFRGADGGAVSEYWTTGVDVVGLSMISFTDVLCYGDGTHGNGVSVVGDAGTSPNYGIIYNFTRCTFLSLGVGVNYGSYIQGVTFGQCNFTNCVTGIHVPSGAVGATQLAVALSQFDCTNANIFIEAAIAGLLVTNSLFYIASSGFGIVCSSTGFQSAITGNVFSGEAASSSTTGISIGGNITGSLAAANTFYNLTVGIDLGGTSTWLVYPNVYESVTTPIANPGTNRTGPDFVAGGGSVTQATSKSTNVTLNKRCGQIVMNGASLGAGAAVNFILVNSFLTAKSVFTIRNSASVGTAQV